MKDFLEMVSTRNTHHLTNNNRAPSATNVDEESESSVILSGHRRTSPRFSSSLRANNHTNIMDPALHRPSNVVGPANNLRSSFRPRLPVRNIGEVIDLSASIENTQPIPSSLGPNLHSNNDEELGNRRRHSARLLARQRNQELQQNDQITTMASPVININSETRASRQTVSFQPRARAQRSNRPTRTPTTNSVGNNAVRARHTNRRPRPATVNSQSATLTPYQIRRQRRLANEERARAMVRELLTWRWFTRSLRRSHSFVYNVDSLEYEEDFDNELDADFVEGIYYGYDLTTGSYDNQDIDEIDEDFEDEGGWDDGYGEDYYDEYEDGEGYEEYWDLADQIGPARHPGLSNKALDALPKTIFHRNNAVKQSGSTDSTPCAICLGTYEEGAALCKLPACPHTFHYLCAREWLGRKATCPVCRHAVHPFGAHNPITLDI